MDFLIKLLGGYSKHDMEKMSLTADSWRTRAMAAETTVELFKEIMTRERERSDELMKKLFPESKPQEQAPSNLKPVGNSVSSWPRIRREMERVDRINAQVPREKVESEIRQGQQNPV